MLKCLCNRKTYTKGETQMNDKATFEQDRSRLIQAVLALKNEEECSAFFEDIFTIQELHAIAQRLKVAGMLKNGMTCQHIAEETGASTATISRVNRSLNYGNDGYEMVMERIRKNKTEGTDEAAGSSET